MAKKANNHIPQPETVAVGDLKPHPKNYRGHPESQVKHLMKSIEEHGLYRNIVVAKDLTILAGHGVATAVTRLGLPEVQVIRLDLDADDPRALKILAGDNEIAHLAHVDDRALTELLKDIGNTGGLLGTGYDSQMLAALVMVTRPASEIKDFDAAAEWLGMPEYEAMASTGMARNAIMVHFRNDEDRMAFGKLLNQDVRPKYCWYPVRTEKDDLVAIKFASRDTGSATSGTYDDS